VTVHGNPINNKAWEEWRERGRERQREREGKPPPHPLD